MIDLSALIALLTALASAAAPTQPGPPEPGDAPPGQHCRADVTTTGSTRSDSVDRDSGATRGDLLPVPSPGAGSWPEIVPDESDLSRTRQLQDSSKDEDTSTESGETEHEDDVSADQEEPDTQNSPSRTGSSGEESSTTRDPRPSRDAIPDSGGDQADQNPTNRSTPSRRTPTGDETGGRERDPAPSRDRSTDPADPADPANPANGGYPLDPACTDRPRERAPDPPAETPTTNLQAPSDLVDLGNWYLTLPTGPEGDPDTVQPSQLTGYSSAYFRLNEARDGVVFTVPVDGATTRNSDYPRSELREMNGAEEAAWSNGSGTHTLRATEAVTELPESKPELVTAQIHGGDDDIMQIRLEGNHLMVQYADGAKQVTLDPDYRLGAPYDIEIVATANSVQVGYNGELKADLPLSGSTWYFKAGAYVQSNPSKGDAATAAGQVIIYSLEVNHT